MEASEEQLDALLELQKIDVSINRLQKEFDALPQRNEIVEVREKISTVAEKRTQVSALLRENETKLTLLAGEDEDLSIKEADEQHTLEEVQGDYRSVEAHSKNLSGIAKRRESLSFDLDALEKRVAEVRKVNDQISAMLASLEKREAELIDSFKREGGSLRAALAKSEEVRTQLVAELPSELNKLYERTRNVCGGIAVSELIDDSCSVCRTALDPSGLSQVRSQAPLATCPSCRRVMVVR